MLKTKFKIGDLVKDNIGSERLIGIVISFDGLYWYNVLFQNGVKGLRKTITYEIEKLYE